MSEKLIGTGNIFFGQHEQKLLGAARAQQHAGKLQLGEQGARQHFTEEREPSAAPEQLRRAVAIAGCRSCQELFGTEQLGLQKDLQRHGERSWRPTKRAGLAFEQPRTLSD
jgi:hypothetical protein